MTKFQTGVKLSDNDLSESVIGKGSTLRKTSTYPSDYGLRRYTDLEVATHSIMIEGLPKDIPRRTLEQKIWRVFETVAKNYEQKKCREDGQKQSFKEQIMQVSVISNFGKCLDMVEDLKLAAGRYKKCLELNNENAERVMQKQKKCCGEEKEVDAEEMYYSQIEDLKMRIKEESSDQASQNIGVCFITFRDYEVAKQMLNTKWVKEEFNQKISKTDINTIGINNLSIHMAYIESDIEWNSLHKS